MPKFDNDTHHFVYENKRYPFENDVYHISFFIISFNDSIIHLICGLNKMSIW